MVYKTNGVKPTPGPNQIVIGVKFAGVNRPDILQRKGLYQPPAGASPILGLEVSGEVVAIGPEVSAFALGDRVMALLAGGGYAQYAIADAGLCHKIPEKFDYLWGAGLCETLYTCFANFRFDRDYQFAGKRVLIHGGASGIGTTAIQLCRAMGAEVAITAGQNEKCHLCTKLGANLAINYQKQHYAEVIKEKWGGIDFSLNIVGGATIHHDLQLLNPNGVLVFLSFLAGAQQEVDFSPILRKKLTISGSTLRPRPLAEKTALIAQCWAECGEYLQNGQIKPILDRVFRLADAGKAHQYMEENQTKGKVLLQV